MSLMPPMKQPSFPNSWVSVPWIDITPDRIRRSYNGQPEPLRKNDLVFLHQCLAKMRLMDTFYRSTDPEREETKHLIEAALATQPTGRKDE